MSLTHRRILRGLVAVLLTCIGVGADPIRLVARQQSAADPAAIDQRLARVGADIFSGTPQVDADIAELKAILAANPKSAQAHMLLGLAYRTKGSTDLMGEAAGELRQAAEIDPTLIPARVYLAHLYLDLGRPERAGEELQTAIAQMPGQPQLQALLGECQRQLGKPDAALELTSQALKTSPSLAEARYYQGLALYDLKRRDEAIQAFEEVLKGGGTRSEVYASLGNAYLDAGRLDEAVKSLTAGVMLEPSRADLLIQLAHAYRLKGQLTQAETWLTRARTLVPETAVSGADQLTARDLSFEEGLVRLKLGQLDAAARNLRKSVDVDPNYGPGYRYLAEVYLRQGLYTRALDAATRAGTLGSPLPDDLQKTLQQKIRASPPKSPV